MENSKEKATQQEVIPGVPNRVTPKTQNVRIAGKDVVMPIMHVATVKGGLVGYNELGKRISHIHRTQEERLSLTKAIARMNALRRQNVLPGELKPAAPNIAR